MPPPPTTVRGPDLVCNTRFSNFHDLYLLFHSLTQCLGCLGVVLKVLQNTGDVRVATCGRKWTMNPLCMVPAPDEAPPLIIDGI